MSYLENKTKLYKVIDDFSKLNDNMRFRICVIEMMKTKGSMAGKLYI